MMIERRIILSLSIYLIGFGSSTLISAPMITRGVNRAEIPSWLRWIQEPLPGTYSSKVKEKTTTENIPFRGGRNGRKAAAQERAIKAPKTMREMDLSELHVRKDELILQHHDKFTAIKYLEKMIPLCDDFVQKSIYILELADLYFDTGRLQDAELRYQEYVLLYPGQEEVKYARYKMVLCINAMVLTCDRDQDRTRQTRTLAQEFLKDFEYRTPYAKEVQSILAACERKLLDSELYICNFYINNNCCNAAKKRLEQAAIDFNLRVPECSGLIQEMHAQLVQKQLDIGLKDIPFKLDPELLQGATRAVIVAEAPVKKLMVDYF